MMHTKCIPYLTGYWCPASITDQMQVMFRVVYRQAVHSSQYRSLKTRLCIPDHASHGCPPGQSTTQIQIVVHAMHTVHI